MANHMSNGILNKLNQSLEITLRDSLDGLEDFTLMMAYASTRSSFENPAIIYPPSQSMAPDEQRPQQSAQLTMVDTEQHPVDRERQQRRA